MAVSVIHKPGHLLGPCEEPCSHVRCARERGMVKYACYLCLRPLGYGRLYAPTLTSDVDQPFFAHVSCIERDAKERGL
jgi:hypothetical protein